jgi:ATP-binding cassette subfamily C protein LapB
MKQGEIPPVIDLELEPHSVTGPSSDKLPGFNADAWLEALERVAKHYRIPVSLQATKLAAVADINTDAKAKIRAMARHMGLGVRLVTPAEISLSTWHLPFILILRDSQLAVVHTLSSDGQASVWLTGEEGLEQPFRLEDLLAETEIVVLARPSKTIPDARVDAYIKPYEDNWVPMVMC